LPVLQSCLP